MHKLDPNDPIFNGFDEEFNYIENKTAHDQFFGDYKSAMLGENKTKNRYSNVLPPESTRVQLSNTGEEGSDYINANYISGLIPNSERAYVATQGPLMATFPDFWRMVWELNVSVIVMLTKEVENGRLKCDRYWPDIDESLEAGNFVVTLSDIEETSMDELLERKLILLNIEKQESRPVLHLQYIAWPDHGLPVSTTAFLSLMDEAYKFNHTGGPIVVHCSAGIGRSGTFCTVHAILEKLKLDLMNNPEEDPKLSIVRTVLAARSQRPGMVQTKEQYMFVYLAILEKTKEILQKHKEARTQKLFVSQ
jgi:protein tyrosine phosphatase